MASGLLSLKWNNHRSTFFHVLSTIRSKDSYCDVTLACDGRFYPLHKFVLSTCSEYFEEMFERTQCKHPIIVLKDIKYDELEALLNYMYVGEVNVMQEKLADLIKAAECLKIKGLAVPDEEPVQVKKDNSSLGREQQQKRSQRIDDSPSAKRRRKDNQSNINEKLENSIVDTVSHNNRLTENHHRQSLSEGHESDGDKRTVRTRDSDASDIEHNDSTQSHGKLSDRSRKLKSSNSTYTNEVDLCDVKPEPIELEDDDCHEDNSEDTKELLHEQIMEASDEPADDQMTTSGAFQDSFQFWEEDGGCSSSFPIEDLMRDNSIDQQMVPLCNVGDTVIPAEDMRAQLGGLQLDMVRGMSVQSSEAISTSTMRPTSASSQLYGGATNTNDTNNGCNALQCSKCPFKTNILERLQKHLLTHTKERPHACPFCSYRASQMQALQSHIRIHTGEKPFACPHCSYRATQRATLNSHIFTHTGEKPYACPHCSYRSNRKHHLASHLASMHRETETNKIVE